MARQAATRSQKPDPRDGEVETAGCVSKRSSHLQVISLGALKKWESWRLDISDAFPRADGFCRDIYVRAPGEWISKDARRIMKLEAPAYSLGGSPAAFRQSWREYSVESVESPFKVGHRFEAPSVDPSLYFVLRISGGAVGAIARNIGDFSGCGEPDLLLKARRFSERRFGKLKVQETPLMHMGMALAQEDDFSATSTQEDFAKNPQLPP